jgi:hypothetical protein
MSMICKKCNKEFYYCKSCGAGHCSTDCLTKDDKFTQWKTTINGLFASLNDAQIATLWRVNEDQPYEYAYDDRLEDVYRLRIKTKYK